MKTRLLSVFVVTLLVFALAFAISCGSKGDDDDDEFDGNPFEDDDDDDTSAPSDDDDNDTASDDDDDDDDDDDNNDDDNDDDDDDNNDDNDDDTASACAVLVDALYNDCQVTLGTVDEATAYEWCDASLGFARSYGHTGNLTPFWACLDGCVGTCDTTCMNDCIDPDGTGGCTDTIDDMYACDIVFTLGTGTDYYVAEMDAAAYCDQMSNDFDCYQTCLDSSDCPGDSTTALACMNGC